VITRGEKAKWRRSVERLSDSFGVARAGGETERKET
jgi:hypothetical protein